MLLMCLRDYEYALAPPMTRCRSVNAHHVHCLDV